MKEKVFLSLVIVLIAVAAFLGGMNIQSQIDKKVVPIISVDDQIRDWANRYNILVNQLDSLSRVQGDMMFINFDGDIFFIKVVTHL